MGRVAVGGDPDGIASGAAQLSTTAHAIDSAAAPIDRAGTSGSSAAQTEPMAGAIARFGAAYGRTVTDIATEMRAAAKLAANAAADLQTAGGGPDRPR